MLLFLLHRRYNFSSPYIKIFKILALLCDFPGRPVCVEPGRKSQRPGFSDCGSNSESPICMDAHDELSHVVRKRDYCLCENKGADQLYSNCTADQNLCFHYMDSTIPLLPKSKNYKVLAIFCSCKGQFVSDLVVNPKDWFSRDVAHFVAHKTYNMLYGYKRKTQFFHYGLFP